jgi:ribosomal protein L2
MALIKAKPTSPGRRFVVSVKTPGLHKGKPFAALLEKKAKTGGRKRLVISVVATSSTTGLSTSSATRMVSMQ